MATKRFIAITRDRCLPSISPYRRLERTRNPIRGRCSRLDRYCRARARHFGCRLGRTSSVRRASYAAAASDCAGRSLGSFMALPRTTIQPTRVRVAERTHSDHPRSMPTRSHTASAFPACVWSASRVITASRAEVGGGIAEEGTAFGYFIFSLIFFPAALIVAYLVRDRRAMV